MGHLVNPISLRLGYNRNWNSLYVSNNLKNYLFLFYKEYNCILYLNWIFNKLKELGVILSHYRFIKINKIFYISCYIYFGNIENFFYYHFNLYTNKEFLEKHADFIEQESEFLLVNNNDPDVVNSHIVKDFIYSTYCKFIFNFFWHEVIIQLKKILNFNRFTVSLYSVNMEGMTASVLAKYICDRLLQHYSLNEILFPIINNLNNLNVVLGFKISCSGRFTRKEIATYSWVREGVLPLNTLDKFIDYSYEKVRLKYSLCGIKVWLHYSRNIIYYSRKVF